MTTSELALIGTNILVYAAQIKMVRGGGFQYMSNEDARKMITIQSTIRRDFLSAPSFKSPIPC